MMARRRVQDAQQSHPQPHPAKRGKRGRPKGQTPPMVTVSGIRIPADVYDVISVASIKSRTSIKRIVRGMLIAAARRPAAN